MGVIIMSTVIAPRHPGAPQRILPVPAFCAMLAPSARVSAQLITQAYESGFGEGIQQCLAVGEVAARRG